MANSAKDKKLQEWLNKTFPMNQGESDEVKKKEMSEEMDEGELSEVLQALGAGKSETDKLKVKDILQGLENDLQDSESAKDKRIRQKQKAFLERIIKDDQELSWLREEYPELQEGGEHVIENLDESSSEIKERKAKKKKKKSSKKKKEKQNSIEIKDRLKRELSEDTDDDSSEVIAPYSEEKISNKKYKKALSAMQKEMVLLQNWVAKTGQRVVIIFEGRDASGKGGTIKRIIEYLNPRVVRIEALPKPTEKERTQWYFQRYVDRLPAAGEIVLFDRSWYNRGGVEPVMGFCTEKERDDFLQNCPNFESMLIEDGIILLKYWFEINHVVQKKRLQRRVEDPSRQWKIGMVDLQALEKFSDYTKARDLMFQHTHSSYSPWNMIKANVKKHARLNCMHHILKSIPYEEMHATAEELALRPLVLDPDYQTPEASKVNYVKEKYKA